MVPKQIAAQLVSLHSYTFPSSYQTELASVIAANWQ